MRNSEPDVDQLLAEEGEASELNKDAPITERTEVSQPNQHAADVLPVRLTADEMRRLRGAANLAGLPPSTLVRSLILRALD